MVRVARQWAVGNLPPVSREKKIRTTLQESCLSPGPQAFKFYTSRAQTVLLLGVYPKVILTMLP